MTAPVEDARFLAMRALTTLVLVATACGAPRARSDSERSTPAAPAAEETTVAAPEQAVPPEPETELAAVAPSEPEAPPAPEHVSELALACWISDEGDGPFDRIVWDEDARDLLVLDGEPWGATDQFEVHAALAPAGSSSPARFTIEARACRLESLRGRSAGTTRAFGTQLRWRDVSRSASAPGGCTIVAGGIDQSAYIHDTPIQCPATAHAYVADHCSHGICIRFGLFDDVLPRESALAQAAARATIEWVSAPGPADPCE